MDVALTHVVVEVAGDRLGLGDLLGLETLTLEHVHEVHVAADVELHRAVQNDSAVFEQPCQHPVGDGGSDLALDVVSDDRDAGGAELLRPGRGAGDEDRQRVDERHLGVDGALRVEPGGVFRPDRQVADQHIDAGLTKGGDDVDRLLGRLLDGLAVVLAQTVVGVTALDGDPGGRHLGDLDGVVLAGADGFREVGADLLAVDVKRGNELDVADVVLAELDMHEAGHSRL